ncbi:MAG TPA: M81 family metallopeptidase [Rhizomicrobium sp.]|nr:M81 family metallopeptidase [Rhizomicrobium sp.]
MKKVFLAGTFHETHSFTDDRTGFEGFIVHRGKDLLDRKGEGSQVDGFLTIAAREGWQVIPSSTYTGGASGMVEQVVFETFWDEIKPVLTTALDDGLDAVFLSLHGAMVTSENQDPDGELMQRIRALPGAEKLPVFGVFDLHANMTPKRGALSNSMVCYRECPHTDCFDTAKYATELLARCLNTGVAPRHHVLVTPIVWPPTGTGTSDDPMKALEAAARRIEREVPGVLAVNVAPGYSYADVYNSGVSFGIVTEGDDAAAKAALQEMANLAWEMRQDGIPKEYDLDELVRNYVPNGKGPVLLVDSADNVGGGAPGDGTEVMRAFVKHDVPRAGVIIADPAAVAKLQSVPVGGRVTLAIGGKGWRLDPGPLSLEVELISRSDGHFYTEDANSNQVVVMGRNINMGPSAVVRHRGVTILLTSVKMAPFDLAMWRSQGVEPTQLSMIGIKAAVGHRAAYEPIASASYNVATNGPCTTDLTRLPFKNIRRPVFPLDPAAGLS